MCPTSLSLKTVSDVYLRCLYLKSVFLFYFVSRNNDLEKYTNRQFLSKFLVGVNLNSNRKQVGDMIALSLNVFSMWVFFLPVSLLLLL